MTNLMSPFQDFQKMYPAVSPAAARARADAANRFEELGLPAKSNEGWHYTSVKPLAELDFKLALLERGAVVTKNLQRYLSAEFSQVVFIDGKFVPEISQFDEIEKYLVFSAEAERNDLADSAFELLNRGFAHQELQINIPSDTMVEKPVQILSYITMSKVMTHPFCRLVLGARSKISLVECFAGSGANYLQNAVSQFEIGNSAKLEYLRIQNDQGASFNIGSTKIKMGNGSALESLSVSLGAKLGRHDLQVDLHGLGGSATVNGVTLGFGDQHLDHSTLIDHQVGEGTTSQLYKAVLGDRARSVFTGKVMIQKGAQKAASEQLNNNLLLSGFAEADSRPQLEILADDVKAAHGSTVGQLNEEELFYLESRAIPKAAAIEMLSVGFLQELVFRINDLRVQKYLNSILLEAYKAGGRHE